LSTQGRHNVNFSTSNSEIDIYNTCERKWWYAFALGLRPKRHTEALSYGVLGHKALEEFYRAKLDGADLEESRLAGQKVILEYMAKNFNNPVLFQEEIDIAEVVASRFNAYVDYYKDDGWRVISVENTLVSTDVIPGIDYYMTSDLLAEETIGPYRGQIILIDHKWCYNFWTDVEATMHPQIPKYIDTARVNGYPDIKMGVINQIRYRSNAKELFRRKYIEPSNKSIETIRYEEGKAVREVEALARQDVKTSATLVRRKMQRRTCKECAFNLPCRMELNGEDPTEVFVEMFEPKDYGYR